MANGFIYPAICIECGANYLVSKQKLATSKFCSLACRQGLRHRTQVDPVTECWNWTGTTNGKFGYGIVIRNGKSERAHRVSYEAHIGPIPDGLVLDHLCKNPSCINPQHLEAVTSGENTIRGERIQRARRATHCPNGHSWTAANTYRNPRSNSRVCRRCTAESVARYQQKRKGTA